MMAKNVDVYNFIVSNEKLDDIDLIAAMEEKFWYDKMSRNYWMDLIRATRSVRPKIIRMGNVPTTNWCMKG
jgi:hypothetical protein